MQWFHKYIDDPSAAFSECDRYQAAMEALFLLSGTRDAAIYSRLDNASGGVHYYFTPTAKRVATSFNATPCQKPSRDEIGSLLVGDMTLIDRLYP